MYISGTFQCFLVKKLTGTFPNSMGTFPISYACLSFASRRFPMHARWCASRGSSMLVGEGKEVHEKSGDDDVSASVRFM